MSSRNARLSEKARKQATAIYKNLLYARTNIFKKDFEILKKEMADNLLKNGFDKIDYIELCDAATLKATKPTRSKQMIVLIAAFIEGVRLIDNLLL
jgi:pantoate--beta-alanine ligase